MNSMSFKPNIERDFGELKSISLMMCSFITTKLNFLVELLTINVFFLFSVRFFIDSSFWNKILCFDETSISYSLIGQLQPFWGFH